MKALFTSYPLKNLSIKNRVVVPPMVCFGYSDQTGYVTQKNEGHYRALAQGGAGMIVIEATCILPEGRLSLDQLGLWEDGQILGLSKLTKICHEEGAVCVVQLHHAGEKCHKSLGDFSVNDLSEAALEHLIEAYVAAAKRAEKSGVDGIELHGAHGYLLCQMASPQVNQRTDLYGGNLEKRLYFAKEIIKRIKQNCPELKFVAYRMGADEPDLKTGIEIAKKLESYGVDLLHVSSGLGGAEKPSVPETFKENWIAYMGSVIKKSVSVPVILVNGIRNSAHASELIEKGEGDFIALGRPHLVDAAWTQKVSSGAAPVDCLNCKPCRWFKDGSACPRKISETEK